MTRKHKTDELPSVPAGLQRAVRLIYIALPLSAYFVRQAYGGAVFGVLWLVIRPLVAAAAVTFVVKNVAGIEDGDIPFVLYFLSGLSVWMLFQRGVAWSTRGFIRGKGVIFNQGAPPLVAQISSFAPALVEGSVVFLVFVGTAAFFEFQGFYDFNFTWGLLFIFAPLLQVSLISIGVGAFLSIPNYHARDVWYTTRYVLGFMAVVTPVYYPSEIVPEKFKFILEYNILNWIVEFYRLSIFSYHDIDIVRLVIATAFSFLFFISGVVVFQRFYLRLQTGDK